MKYSVFCSILIFLTIPFLTAFSPADFISSLDYEFSENYVKKTFTIPEEFDIVYERYNLIQLEAGFDLSLYKGKKCEMYTFEIYNHPFGKCNANIICYGDTVIGGDISSVSIDGFMTPLE